MKILYDQQIFGFQDYGGISRYFYELIKGVKGNGNKVLVDGKFSNNIFLPKLKKDVSPVLPRVNFPHKNILNFYLNFFFDSENLKKGDFDLLHITYYHPYFFKYLKGKPYIVTVYDMTHELFTSDSKGFVERTIEFKRKTITGADKIITISENTKKDIIKIYGIPEERIKVIYLGNSLEGVKPLKVNNLPDRYLLFVGSRAGYKNFELFVKAMAPIIKEDKNLHLVCAGGGEFSVAEKELLAKLGVKNKVRQVGFKSDGELAFIYKKALVYVLPSLYEGFGMTALEAFSANCPVVAGDTGSIPEVCGKAAVYINSRDSGSIRMGVQKVLEDKKIRQRLIQSGFEQVRKFSWGKTVKETLKVYKSLLDQ